LGSKEPKSKSPLSISFPADSNTFGGKLFFV